MRTYFVVVEEEESGTPMLVAIKDVRFQHL